MQKQKYKQQINKKLQPRTTTCGVYFEFTR